MNGKPNKFDYIIVGAGIIGLTIAKALVEKTQAARILIIEKEQNIGLHSSGRNSGVLHSGIYYPAESLKAKVCASGARRMISYCEQNQLSLNRIGKVIVPFKRKQDKQLLALLERAEKNGAKVELIDSRQLKKIEPEAYSITGGALYSPNTYTVDPLQILLKIRLQLEENGVEFCYQTDISTGLIDPENSTIEVQGKTFQYSVLYNAAGLFADKIAKQFNAGKDYTMMPFKGIYYKLKPENSLKINGLIYPVPDLNVPFLGVHSVKTSDGGVYFGPSATPAWGRENYYGLKGFNTNESGEMLHNLIKLFVKNNDNFRHYLFEETQKLTKYGFCEAIQKIVPAIHNNHLQTCEKVGIRAQLLNMKTMQLEMDFIVERVGNTVHILNAVSPAFTSALEFSERVVNNDI